LLSRVAAGEAAARRALASKQEKGHLAWQACMRQRLTENLDGFPPTPSLLRASVVHSVFGLRVSFGFRICPSPASVRRKFASVSVIRG
jgi:hypothetical protein